MYLTAGCKLTNLPFACFAVDPLEMCIELGAASNSSRAESNSRSRRQICCAACGRRNVLCRHRATPCRQNDEKPTSQVESRPGTHSNTLGAMRRSGRNLLGLQEVMGQESLAKLHPIAHLKRGKLTALCAKPCNAEATCRAQASPERGRRQPSVNTLLLYMDASAGWSCLSWRSYETRSACLCSAYLTRSLCGPHHFLGTI